MEYEQESSRTVGRHHIFFLARFFEKERHATDFMNGQLRANKLSYYKKLEEGQKDGRRDKYEGMIAWGQPGRVRIEINGHDMSSDLAGPVSLSSDRIDEFNIICLYAACIRNCGQELPQDLEEIRHHSLIPTECEKFGKYAVVITNGPEFLNRVENAAKSNSYQEAHGLVKYYDPSTYSGSFLGIRGAFMKQERYRCESEYRIVLETRIVGNGVICLNIGDIRDIAIRSTIDEINRTLEISHIE